MSSHIGIKTLAGAIALAIGGTAMSQTLNPPLQTGSSASPGGSVFLDIVDNTQGTSFLFNTNLTTTSFNGSGSYSFNVASDTNYASFLASEKGGDQIVYSVIGTSFVGTSGTQQFTSNSVVTAASGNNVGNALSVVQTFVGQANLTPTTVASSTFTTGGSSNSQNWQSTEPSVQNFLSVTDSASIGTALAYYSESSSHLTKTTNTQTTLSEFAGTWDLSSSGVLTYGGAAPVPLPAPLMLLLSGLGLMGVVSRRNKAAV
jgi:hypothetical protein